MGYKLAGGNVVAASDIDPDTSLHYKNNLDTDYFFEMPICDLVEMARKGEMPEELMGIDLLDGSPPCSTFSLAGNREKDWGKERVFREGQAKQILSDLFFDYLDLVDVVAPRFFVAENVPGILVGNAKGYIKQIVQRARDIGYRVQVFKLNALQFGVPQSRGRVFIIGRRASLDLPDLVIRNTINVPRTVDDAWHDLVVDPQEKAGRFLKENTVTHMMWASSLPGDSLGKTYKQRHGKSAFFTHARLHPYKPSPCLIAGGTAYHPLEPRKLTSAELYRLSSFPDDYAVVSKKAAGCRSKIAEYLVGMSVPPRFMEAIARAIQSQWHKRSE